MRRWIQAKSAIRSIMSPSRNCGAATTSSRSTARHAVDGRSGRDCAERVPPMIEIPPAAFLRYLLRVGVFLLVGPLIGGIAYEVWLLWSSILPRSPFEFLARFVFVIFCAYGLGWKAAVATG